MNVDEVYNFLPGTHLARRQARGDDHCNLMIFQTTRAFQASTVDGNDAPQEMFNAIKSIKSLVPISAYLTYRSEIETLRLSILHNCFGTFQREGKFYILLLKIVFRFEFCVSQPLISPRWRSGYLSQW